MKIFYILLFIAISTNIFPKSNNIIFKVKGATKHSALIVKSNLDSWYLIDSFSFDKNGELKLPNNILEEEGLYYLILKNNTDKFLPFLKEEKKIKIVTDTTNLIDYAIVTEGSDNQLLLKDYQNTYRYIYKSLATIKDSFSYPKLKAALMPYTDSVRLFRNNLLKDKSHSALYKLLYPLTFADIPIIYTPFFDVDKLKPIYYLKTNQYYDILKIYSPQTNLYPAYNSLLIDFVFNKINGDTIEMYNSLNPFLDELSKQNNIAFDQTLKIIYNKLNRSDSVINENLWIYLYNQYFSKFQSSWFNNEKRDDMKEFVSSLLPYLVGNKMPNFSARDTNFNKLSLYNIDASKTIIIFWNPNSAGVNKAIYNFKNKIFDQFHLDKKNYKLVLISISDKHQNFIETIRKFNDNRIIYLENRAKEIEDLNNLFNKYSTSSIFILDENKIIIDKGFRVLNYKIDDF